MNKLLLLFSLSLFILSCQPEQKNMSEAEIDQIVDNISDPEHL